MVVKLNRQAFEHATNLIEQGKFVFDEKDMWSEHQPSAEDENAYLREHGFGDYGKWYLGIDTAEDEETKGRYKFMTMLITLSWRVVVILGKEHVL